MGDRDPRLDPQPGDVIKQQGGIVLVVTARDGNAVAWSRRTYHSLLVDPNSWTVSGWSSFVAKGAKILEQAHV